MQHFIALFETLDRKKKDLYCILFRNIRTVKTVDISASYIYEFKDFFFLFNHHEHDMITIRYFDRLWTNRPTLRCLNHLTTHKLWAFNKKEVERLIAII